MNLKRNLIYVTLTIFTITLAVGCSNSKQEETNDDVAEKLKGKCEVTECIKQLDTSNSIEEINEIIGFEGTKSE